MFVLLAQLAPFLLLEVLVLALVYLAEQESVGQVQLVLIVMQARIKVLHLTS
jgi:hypothetical protein